LENLKEGLKDEKRGYIYHCHNHYMCPIGFEQTPTMPSDTYSKALDICESNHWIIIADLSKTVFHCKPWDMLYTDFDCAFPRFFNIRKSDLGV
jgi:hypothetical protein